MIFLEGRFKMKKRTVRNIIIILLGYVLFCGLFPPIIGSKFQEGADEDYVYGNYQGVEESIRVQNIEDNEDALLWRLRSICAAKKEIVLVTFDFRDDNSGQDIMSALADAAKRGVHIKLLIDGLNGEMHLKKSNNFSTLCSMSNVEIKFYNPIHFRKLWKINYRMHEKYLIIDNRILILGGRNTNDLFLGNYVDKCNYDRDLLLYVKDTMAHNVLQDLKEHFGNLWESDACEVFACQKIKNNMQDALAEHYKKL